MNDKAIEESEERQIAELREEIAILREEAVENAKLLGISGSLEHKHLTQIKELQKTVLDFQARYTAALEDYSSVADGIASLKATINEMLILIRSLKDKS